MFALHVNGHVCSLPTIVHFCVTGTANNSAFDGNAVHSLEPEKFPYFASVSQRGIYNCYIRLSMCIARALRVHAVA